jgi:hypothetical protein
VICNLAACSGYCLKNLHRAKLLVGEGNARVNENDSVETRASDGDVEAQCALALLYELGIDREIDLSAAKRWWMVAAKAGNAWAQLKLSRYFASTGDKAGDAFAESQWLSKAAEQGMLPRQKSVAALHSKPALTGKIIVGIYDGPMVETVAGELSRNSLDVKLPVGRQTVVEILAEHPDAKMLVLGLDHDLGKSLPILRTLNTLRTSVPIVIVSQKIPRESVAQWQHLQVAKWLNPAQGGNAIAREIVDALEGKSHG